MKDEYDFSGGVRGKYVDRESRSDMGNAKATVRELLNALPDDASFEQIQYAIYVREKIERARQGVRSGEIASEEEIQAIFNKWQPK